MSQPALAPQLDPERVEFYHKLLREMLLVRRFEERAGEAYAQGLIGGFCHLYIGQEAVAVGALAAIRKDDYVFASYREHAHALVQGTSSRAIMAELFGKAEGCSGGKGGSMHLFDVEHNFMGGHGIVGAHLPLAAGAAFTARYRETNQVALCFFGEAAVNIGAFHETLNMAALWELPRAAAVWDVYRRACSYDMAEQTVDGMDVLAVHGAVTNAVTRARDEQLPTLIEARTYRYMGHSMADPIHGHYRTKEELEEQKGKDPIQHLIDQLQGANLLTDETLEQTRQSVEEEVDDALRFADESPDPDPDELFTDVYRD